ncbi:MAG TPA: lactonase family protein, partial [Verrucomicrobiales bacterium]|nr:lactonase family protein [Verrucomicrobiales bacterium]
TGAITVSGTAAELASPSYLAFNPEGTCLYAVSESGNSAAAFKVDKATGALTKLNELAVSAKKDQGACHLCVVPGAKMLVTANYGGGSVSTFSLADDGSLAKRTGFIQHTGGSVNKSRQSEPHGHGALLTPDGEYVLVNDLGTDRVYIYKVDAKEHTLRTPPAGEGVSPPGSGPRHSVFDKDGKHIFTINEMLCTVTTFAWDPSVPSLTAGASVSTLPEPVKPAYSTAEIVVHPSGKFVYGSNRGHNSIAVFSNAGGVLTAVENVPSGGKTPRNFNLTPDGKWLVAAHQDSDNITVFSVNQETGKLTATPNTAQVGKAVCLVFMPGK